jgi:proton glutamate symport protein
MLTLMVTSKGVAAVPRTSLVILASALVQFNLPLQGVAVILGVDAFMDMARTSINVVGNCLASAVMARWEGVFGAEAEHAVPAIVGRETVLHVPAILPSGRRVNTTLYS